MHIGAGVSQEMYLLVTVISVLAAQANSYILLQVRRDAQNRSNVDALIHKVVEPGKFDELVSNIARKQFNNQQTGLGSLRNIQMRVNDRKQMTLKSEANNFGGQHKVKESGESGEWVPDKILIDSDENEEDSEENGKNEKDGEDEEAVSQNPMRPRDRLQPFFRARGIELKPEVINFRSKPSLVYELNSNNIARMMKELLSSKTVAKYMDKMAKRAAEYYKTLRSS